MTDVSNNYTSYLVRFEKFDWELYLINYPDLCRDGFNTKEKVWWHYLQNHDRQLYLDVDKRNEYIFGRKFFDSTTYLEMYPALRDQGYNTPDKLWWHYFNIGKQEGFVYFHIDHHDAYIRRRDQFDHEKYLRKYPFLNDLDGLSTKNQLWWHFVTKGEKQGYLYFGLNEDTGDVDDDDGKPWIIMFVDTTCRQPFNTGIQRVVRNVSNVLGNTWCSYRTVLVKWCPVADDLVQLNQTEADMFALFHGFRNDGVDFNKLRLKKGNQHLFLALEVPFGDELESRFARAAQKARDHSWTTVAMYHDDTWYSDGASELFDRYMKVLTSHFDRVITNSKYSLFTFQKHCYRLSLNDFDFTKAQAIPLAGEVLGTDRATEVGRRRPFVLANISVTKRKNAGTLVRAFRTLLTTHPELTLVIVGVVYNPEDAYFKSFQDLLCPKIVFRSNISDDELTQLYRECAFSVYPSIEEGFGLPIYESLWNGARVICHHATSTGEIAAAVNCSAIVRSIDCLDEQELVDAMEDFLMSTNANEFAQPMHRAFIKTWNQFTVELMRFVQPVTLAEDDPIYYYIDDTVKNPCRTGIQIVAIYLARQWLTQGKPMIFVKWDRELKMIVQVSMDELDTFFHLNEAPNNRLPLARLIASMKKMRQPPRTFFCAEWVKDDINRDLQVHLVKRGLRSVFVLHDLIPLVLTEYVQHFSTFRRYIYTNIVGAHKVLCVSETTKREYRRVCQKPAHVQSVLLPFQYRNSVRGSKKSSSSGGDGDVVTILLPGTIEPRKQQILVMRLFNRFLDEHPDVAVRLVAFGHLWYPREIVDEEVRRSNGRIQFLGLISNDELLGWYQQADFLCFASVYEGFGFPVAESLWHNTPVLTANFGSMAEIARRHGGAWMVDTKDEDCLYRGLCRMIQDRELVSKLREEISHKYMETWEDYARDVWEQVATN